MDTLYGILRVALLSVGVISCYMILRVVIQYFIDQKREEELRKQGIKEYQELIKKWIDKEDEKGGKKNER